MPNLDLLDQIESRAQPTHNAAGKAPIINGYKAAFVKRRILSTLLGGMHVVTGSAAKYIWPIQLTLFLLPPIVAVVGMVLCVAVSQLVGAIVSGALISVTLGIAELIRRQLSVRVYAAHEVDESGSVRLDGEEDRLKSALAFVVGPQLWWGVELQHQIVAAVVTAAAATAFTSHDILQHDAYYVLVVFGMFAYATAMYPLAGTPPAEPAVYHAQTSGTARFDTLSRALTIGSLFLAATLHPAAAVPLLATAAALPLLWVVGVLPQVTALVPFALEQLLQFGLGGLPPASYAGLIASVAAGLVTWGIVAALLEHTRSSSTLLSAVCVAGASAAVLAGRAPLSLCSRLLANWRRRRQVQPGDTGTAPALSPTAQSGSSRAAHGVHSSLLQDVLTSVVLVLLGIAAPAITVSQFNSKGAQASDSNLWAICRAVWALYALSALRQQLHRVHVFGLIANPFFTAVTTHTAGPSTPKRAFRWLLRCGLSLVSVIGVSAAANAGKGTSTYLLAFGLVRAYRWSLQAPERAALDTAVALVAALAGPANSSWRDIAFPVQLLIVSFCVDRCFGLWQRLRFAALATVSVWRHTSLRPALANVLLAGTIVCAPITAATAAAAALLSAPLVPVFGLPLFFIGFPRPQSFWPTRQPSKRVHPDCVYYEHAMPVIRDMFRSAKETSSLGTPVPGTTFIMRFETRIMVATVVTSGFDFTTYCFQGLELTETSCHTAEATHLETALEDALPEKGRLNPYSVNKHALNAFEARMCATISTFSDTRNVLTGIIDQPAALSLLQDCFRHAFVFLALTELDGASVRSAHAARSSTPGTSAALDGTGLAAVPSSFLDRILRETDEARDNAWQNGRSEKAQLSKVSEQQLQRLLTLLQDALFGQNRGVGWLVDVFSRRNTSALSTLDHNVARVAHKSLCFAFKAAIDLLILGDTRVEDEEDMLETLRDFKDNWYIGPETDEWFAAVQRGRTSLFSISRSDQGHDVFASHLLTTQPVKLRLASMNPEAIRGQWAELAWELLYLTNDDEERYSIQAHPWLLRNLTIQFADAPLGYSVFSETCVV